MPIGKDNGRGEVKGRYANNLTNESAMFKKWRKDK
jgi:hypothetical protein